MSFDKETHMRTSKMELEINKLNGVQITNVALFQDKNISQDIMLSRREQCCRTFIKDPSLNTWSKFQDFVMFPESDMNVKYR